MMNYFASRFLCSAVALAAIVTAAPTAHSLDKRSIVERDGTTFNVFEHAATGSRMEFVNNSGICETTPGVTQHSGYFSIGTNMNMWFWFFEARNNPTTAPLATWFNGGPGCSSMIGLFQENGPCHFVNGASTPSNNTNSFNNYANMLYIDQPIGVGFSYGTDDVSSTFQAAPEVWRFLQAFYAAFTQYQSRDFGIFTESYGGHYGPEFASYIDSQNTAIASRSVTGTKINLVALGVNNGWFDAALQEQAYIDYSINNTYNQILTASQAKTYQTALNNKCTPALAQCAKSGSNADCMNSDNVCYNAVEGPISQAKDFDVYDIRITSEAGNSNPPETYVTYLQSSTVMTKIGAQSKYQECPTAPYNKFSSTGDNSRSLLLQLSSVVASGIRIVVWAGDADWICNWLGGYYVAQQVAFSGQAAFRAKALTPYNVKGVAGGTFKTQDNFSFLRVYSAGHEVPYYQGAVALQVFEQTMMGKPLSST